MKVILLAAAAENGVISSAGRLPWHLPHDVAFFRQRTAAAWLLLGRATWEEMTGWFTPEHTPLVLTRRAGFPVPVPGGHAVTSVENAISLAKAGGAAELLVIGGGQVFAAALPFADTVLLTRVRASPPGDTWFPPLPDSEWTVLEARDHPADERHAHAFTFLMYRRVDE